MDLAHSLDADLVEPAITDDPLAPVERQVRGRTLILLRWLAVAGQTVTALFVNFALGFDTPLAAVLAVIAASAWVNIIFSFAAPPQRLLSDRQAAAQLAFDTIQLSTLIALTGGLSNPFVLLLAAPVVIAFSALRASYAIALAGLALAGTAVMAVWSAPLPWVAGQAFAPPIAYQAGLWAALVTGAGFMSVFAWRAAADARRMSGALSATHQILAREQRLSALGGLAAAAAHELGTPLGTIQVVAKEIARAAPPDSDLAEDAALMLSQASRCRDILKQLSARGAENDAVHAELSLRLMVEEVIEPLLGIGPEIVISFVPPQGETWPGARTPKIRRLPEMLYAVSNYVENAVDYAKTRIDVVARWSDTSIEIEVSDDGPGFPIDVMAKLGEPYVTRRDPNADSHGGLGLGFFIAKTFVERTGGTVRFGNRRAPATGAIVRASWPLARVSPEKLTNTD